MSIQRAVAAVSVAASLVAVGTGCETKSFIDPSEMGRYEKTPKVVPILDKLVIGVEANEVLFPTARDVTDADLQSTAVDYKIGPGDLLQITIQDLAGQGLQQVESKLVSESGKVSLPYLGQVSVTGQTEAEAEAAIVKAYADAQILPRAIISVAVAQSQNRIYTVSGAANAGGPYALTRADFRLLDALAAARGVTSEQGIDYIYVIRRKSPGEAAPASTPPAQPGSPDADPLAPASAPQSRATPAGRAAGTPIHAMIAMQATPAAATPPAPRTAEEARMQANDLANQISAGQTIDPLAAPTTMPARATANTNDRVIQIEGAGTRPAGNDAPSDGSAPRVTSIPPTASVNSTTAQPPISDAVPFTGPNDSSSSSSSSSSTSQPFEFTAPSEPTDREVIRVPYQQLRDGALKYNIVIKPQDLIQIPQPSVGEYYMAGHVQRTGVYSLTARKITLKQAVASAGMLDQLAIPARTDIVRRTGTNQEVFVRVDLERIFSGLEPDVFLHKDDIVTVGTNAGAPFLAALRNAFRITYGFGFLYDRNYGPGNNNNN